MLNPITGAHPAACGTLSHALGSGSGGPTPDVPRLALLDGLPVLPEAAAAAAATAAAASAEAEAPQVTPNGRSGGGSDSGGPTPGVPTPPLPNGHTLPGVSAGAASAATQATQSTVDGSGGASSGSPEQAAHQPLAGSLVAPPATGQTPQVWCPRPERNILACVAGQILFATYSETCYVENISCLVAQQDSGQDSGLQACMDVPVQWHAAWMSPLLRCCAWLRAQGDQGQAATPHFNTIQEAKVQNALPLVFIKFD